MQICDFITNRMAWRDPKPWERFEGYGFAPPGKPPTDLRDAIATRYKIDIEAKVGADAGLMVDLIRRGHETACRDLPGLVPADLIYLLCPMSESNEFVRTYMQGLSGFAAKSAVILYANPVGNWENAFYRMVLHETNHTARYAFGNPFECFRNWAISEGMAEVYVAEKQPGEALSPWVSTAPFAEVLRLLPTVRSFWAGFKTPTGNSYGWFYGSAELGIPKWFGYALGFHLVRQRRRLGPATPWSEFIKSAPNSFDLDATALSQSSPS